MGKEVDVNALKKTIKNLKCIDDPDEFYHLFIYDTIHQSIEAAGIPLALLALWVNYGFFSGQIEKLLTDLEGSPYSADKSGWLLRGFVEYKKTGKLPDMACQDRCYWKPRFGTGRQWMDYIQGLHDLLYGNNVNWEGSLKALMEAHSETKSGGAV